MKRLFTTLLVLSITLAFSFGQVTDDFETGIGNWQDPNYSGSTSADAASSFAVSTEQAHGGVQSGKLDLIDDAGTTGGYFVRLSNRVDQFAPDAKVGFWVYTAATDVEFRLVIWDNGAGGDGYEAGPYWTVSAADTWEYFVLDLANDAVEGWITGNGAINSTDFVTIESIQLNTTSDANAVLYFDDIGVGTGPPPTPFFSQVNEGSSNNKMIEIYNPTDQTINLDEYAFPNVGNDPTVVGEYEFWNTFTTGATIAPGETYVISHGDAVPELLDAADQTFTYLSNGDDGFALVKGTESSFEVIDWIGNWDGDPGDGWDVAGVTAATKDHTLYRKPHVMMGNTNWPMSAGTNAEDSEWLVMPKDTWVGAGVFPEEPSDFWPKVTFKVNVAHQIMNSNFDPLTDYVDVAGDFNGWGPAAGEWQLTAHPDTNGIWMGTFPVAPGEYGFKYRINSSWDAGRHDGGDNRELHVEDMDTEYYGYLDNYTYYPVIFFGVDLTDKFNKGEFDPWADSVNVAGSFNDWGGDPGDLHPKNDDNLKWGAYLDEAGVFNTGDNIEFKFRINENWDNAESIDNRTHLVTDGLQEYTAYWNDFDYNLTVTFEVNMNAQIDANEFDPSSDFVDIAGDFNGWGGNDPEFWKLTDDDADGVWSITVSDSFEVGQALSFKFRKNGDWATAEFPGGSNRQYLVVGGAQTYHVWWNDFDPNFIGAPVTFKVNMNAQADASLFDPAVDKVAVTGVFGAILMDDGDADGIYEVTAPMPLGNTFYRFRINDDTPESLPYDRSVMVEVADVPVVLDVVYFSNVAVVRSGSGNITFRVDMTVLEQLGFYSRADGDSLELRGGVNGWGSDPDRSKIDMIRQPGTEIYFLTVPYSGDAGDVFTYKFFLNLHQIAGGDTAAHAGEDFYEYELPALAGGGDRFFVWNGMDADTVLPVQTFQDYVTEGIIPAGETVYAQLLIDMSEAMTYEDDPFDPATDNLYFIFQDAWGAELQGIAAGDVAEPASDWMFENTWQARQHGPNVWELVVPITGPAPHALMYTTRYEKSDGTEVAEQGAGYGFGRFRTQWLKPETVDGNIASAQALEVVKFSNLGTPLEVFPEPYANDLVFSNATSTGVDLLPTSFALDQNYPNPFNPTTTISYTLPKAVDVELIVFDITGREITRLVDQAHQPAGQYDIMWNGLNASGEKVASGLYFYRINAGDYQQTHKMMMLK
ncbi:MAG: lamin tail domain-containing protein [Candidatus Marinimicrobia bacterium]|nr:lamin tail domain-containing protein [Candidatus Neomarinimicrobiota bacterium]MCF7851058.1 lamin tail domain-containing protein [Candidatus Neomarinimicrobiota bacterium]MCF7904028.1 lamin tail domain-containing protein [Candidatus Neomarinimicrobiota bacterium]